MTAGRQRVILPGANIDWVYIRAGVPEGSILGLIQFQLFINDIVTDIGSNILIFADGTSLLIIVDNPLNAANSLNGDLRIITRWAAQWLLLMLTKH